MNQMNRDAAEIRKAAKIIVHERFNSVLYEQVRRLSWLISYSKPSYFVGYSTDKAKKTYEFQLQPPSCLSTKKTL